LFPGFLLDSFLFFFFETSRIFIKLLFHILFYLLYVIYLFLKK
jgi:hypothetical protein